jgi:hypothetical protein
MEYRCPACRKPFGAAALVVESGLTGAVRCPMGQERVAIAAPYGGLVAIISLLVAWVTLALLHVHTIFGFAIGTVVIWVPLRFYLNAASRCLRPAKLKRWKSRRGFIPWLNERNAPQELFDKRRR